MKTVMYHNPRCSKSRATLALLQERGVEVDVVRYLEAPPTADELATILGLLGISPRALMRTKEAAYQESGAAADTLTDAELIAKMVEHPVLIERPIVVVDGKRAAIGRPPEAVLALL